MNRVFFNNKFYLQVAKKHFPIYNKDSCPAAEYREEIMLGLRRIIRIINRTGTFKILLSYLFVLIAGGIILNFIAPEVHNIFEGIYFCFVASTTIGFGDIVPVTAAGRIITIIVTLFGILTVAMVPGVVVAYYTEYLKIQEKETISAFLDKLEHLPDLSKNELKELSDRVKKFNKVKVKKHNQNDPAPGDEHLPVQ